MSMSARRFAIAQQSRSEHNVWFPVHDLEPGTHRVTVHVDGTIERVAMQREWGGWWSDVPAEPERSPQVSDVSASEPRDGARD